MNDNGHTQLMQHPQTLDTKKSRKALGRGLKDILESQNIYHDHFHELPEHIKASHIGSKILELIDLVDAKYHPVIFNSVSAYQSVNQVESTESIGKRLYELENLRIKREKEIRNPQKRWYYLYLR